MLTQTDVFVLSLQVCKLQHSAASHVVLPNTDLFLTGLEKWTFLPFNYFTEKILLSSIRSVNK